MSAHTSSVVRSTRPEDRPRRRRPAEWFGSGAVILLLVLAFGPTAGAAIVPTVGLGTAASFSVLAGETVTNTGPTSMPSSLGVSPGSAVVGFPPGIVNAPGVIHAGDAVALGAKSDLVTAYNNAAGRPTNALTGAELGGQTLQGGVYAATATKDPLQVTGTLTLDGAGNSSSVWIFQTGSTVTTASDSVIALVNGASACNVFWQVGSSATLGTRTKFVGNLLALTSATLQDGVTVNGRILARNGAVTLMNDTFTGPDCTPAASATTTTTTTAAPTTTTAAPTTTTAAPTTTTTEAPIGTDGPTTTTTTTEAPVGATGTTIAMANGLGAAQVTTTTTPSSGQTTTTTAAIVTTGTTLAPALPRTGGDMRSTLVAAVFALGVGRVLLELRACRERAVARR